MSFRIEVTSTADPTVALYPKSMTFEILFLHPCHYTTLSDNGGFFWPLHNAEVYDGGYSGYIDERTMPAYPYSFPSSFTTSPDCGPQVTTINEPSTVPASGQVTFVAGPAPNDGFLKVEAFTGAFNAIGYGYTGDVLDGSGVPIGDYC